MQTAGICWCGQMPYRKLAHCVLATSAFLLHQTHRLWGAEKGCISPLDVPTASDHIWGVCWVKSPNKTKRQNKIIWPTCSCSAHLPAHLQQGVFCLGWPQVLLSLWGSLPNSIFWAMSLQSQQWAAAHLEKCQLLLDCSKKKGTEMGHKAVQVWRSGGRGLCVEEEWSVKASH